MSHGFHLLRQATSPRSPASLRRQLRAGRLSPHSRPWAGLGQLGRLPSPPAPPPGPPSLLGLAGRADSWPVAASGRKGDDAGRRRWLAMRRHPRTLITGLIDLGPRHVAVLGDVDAPPSGLAPRSAVDHRHRLIAW